MNRSTPGLPVHRQLPEFTQTHVHWVSDAIQPSHSLSSPSPPAFNLSQHQGLSQWVNSLHQVVKVLELQLQHQSYQWIFRTDFLQDWLVWSPCSPRDSLYKGEVIYSQQKQDLELTVTQILAKFRLKLKTLGKTTKSFSYDLNQIPYEYWWRWRIDSRH